MDILLLPFLVGSLLGIGLGVRRVLGRWLSESNRADSESEDAAGVLFVSAGLGLGFTSLLILALGALRLLYAPVLWLLLAAGLAILARHRQALSLRGVWTRIRPQGGLEILLAAFILAAMLFQAAGCCPPAVWQDEMTYHLTAPRQFLLAHRIHPTPNLLQANFPFGGHMLYVFCLGLGSETLCRLLQWSQWLLILAIIIVWVRSLQPRGPAGYLGALLYLTPLASVYFRAPTEAGSDMPTALFFTLAFFCVGRMEKSRWRSWLLLAGLFNGFAWGVKYTAMMFLTPALGLYLLWRLWQLKVPLRRGVVSLATFAFVSLAVFCPWMIKSFACTGNPLYPNLKGVFPSPLPYSAMAQRCDQYFETGNFYRESPEGEPSNGSLSIRSALGKALANYRDERVAWSVHEGDFLLVLYLMFSLTGLFLPVRGVRGLAIAGLAGQVVFALLYGSHMNRFFSITYSLGAVLAAVHLGYLLEQLSLRNALTVVFGVGLFLSLASHQLNWCRLMDWQGQPTLTRESRRQYLLHHHGVPGAVEMWEAVAKSTPPNAYILGHGVRYPFHIPRRIYCIGDYEDELIDRLKAESRDWDAVFDEIAGCGFTHLLLGPHADAMQIPSAGLNQHGRRVWSNEQFALWQLVETPEDAPAL